MKKLRQDPCPQCGGKVIGRSDKIFCEIKCKNNHHHYSRRQNKPMTLTVNDNLLRNLTVLQGLSGKNSQRCRVHKSELQRRGFKFGACTSSFIDKQGRQVWELYHIRYFVGNDGVVVVIPMMHLHITLPGFFKRWEQEFPENYVVNGVTAKLGKRPVLPPRV